MRSSYLFLVLFMCACTPTTHLSFVKRADAIYVCMIEVLEKVEHPQDFKTLSALRPLYMEIAELLIASLKQEEKDPELFNLEIIEAPHAERLKLELSRVYALEGGRCAVEQVARDGLTHLEKTCHKNLR